MISWSTFLRTTAISKQLASRALLLLVTTVEVVRSLRTHCAIGAAERSRQDECVVGGGGGGIST